MTIIRLVFWAIFMPLMGYLLQRVWHPVMARGLRPYIEKYTEAEKWEMEEAEAKALIYSCHIGCAIAVADIITNVPKYIYEPASIPSDRLLIVGTACVLSIWLHLAFRGYRRKKFNERMREIVSNNIR
jgi:beta-lactamase regulating signal transducer with metallopeptidase domain